MPSIGTWWRTLRHLRPEQIVGRLYFKLARPQPDIRPAPPLRHPKRPWLAPARRRATLGAEHAFDFLNETHRLADVGWDNPSLAKLWRYNQHYFDDLTALGAEDRHAWHENLVTRWIQDNSPGTGTGWEPYPTSLRIVNWVKWLMSGQAPEREWIDSLATQARWLSQRIEWHLLGNHLFANAKALMLAGLVFEGSEADAWREMAVRIIERELPEQILADGGHFERSPMYHAMALEDILDLLNALACFQVSSTSDRRLAEGLREVAPKLLWWLRCMTFPGGGVTHFNDSSDGVAPSLVELERYARDMGVSAEVPADDSTHHLRCSGYIRIARGPAIAWLDVAPIGPDYLPGHAHADTLSFELALRGQPLIVNGGTSCYGSGPQRQRERGTALHSTVQIDDHDSSEVWSGFRVGRRAYPRDVHVGDGWASAAHDGYGFLPRRPVHRRTWLMEQGVLQVEDTIDPPMPRSHARFHLAPGLTPDPVDVNCWVIRHGAERVGCVEVDHAEARWEPSEHSPEFGLIQPTLAMCCDMRHGKCVVRWSWDQ